MIAHPVQIDVAANAMRVVSEDGTTTIVTFIEDSP
jgi:hypothetical protein